MFTQTLPLRPHHTLAISDYAPKARQKVDELVRNEYTGPQLATFERLHLIYQESSPYLDSRRLHKDLSDLMLKIHQVIKLRPRD